MEYSAAVLCANLCLVCVTIFLIFRYFFRKNTYWKDQNIPYIEDSSLFSLLFYKNKPIQELQMERHQKLGRIYGYYEYNRPVLSIGEPELLQDILVRDFKFFTSHRNEDNSLEPLFGRMLNSLLFEKWRRVRLIVSPTFTTFKLKKLMNILTECALTLTNNLQTLIEKEQFVEISNFLQAFTIDVVASAAFSIKIDSHNNPDNIFVKTAREVFDKCSPLTMWLYDFIPRVLGVWGYNLFSFTSKTKFFEDSALQIIQDRKKSKMDKSDFLQLLINASTKREKSENCEDDFSSFINNFKNKVLNNTEESNDTLTLDEIAAQCVMFFLAGYHSTASAITFTTYLLALHQDIQDKVYQEIKSVIKEKSGPPNFEDLQKLTYLDSVISESLRLYPPAPNLDRVAVQEYKLGNTGIIIPKGMKIRVPLYTLQRDPLFFSQPCQFDPDRFHEDQGDRIIPYSFMPFGAGPRNCVAKKMALFEIKVALAHLLLQFRVQKCPETKIPLEFHKGQTLVPFLTLLPKSVKIKMKRRN